MIHPTVKVSQNKDAMKKLQAALEKAEGSFVKVGWQGPATYPNGTRVAQVAIWNEFGTYVDGKVHVPARPFLRPAIRENEKALMAAAKGSLANVAFKGWKVERGLGAIGFRAQEYIRAKIKSNVGPELADKTEARKRAAGRPLVTLIDTRRMLDTLSFKVTLGANAREDEEHGEGAPHGASAGGGHGHGRPAHGAVDHKAARQANRTKAQAAKNERLAARRGHGHH